jgi:hypothetical protein
MKTFREKFEEYFNNLGDWDQLNIYNEYADANCYKRVYSMSEFNEVMQGLEPMDIALQVRFGDFNPNHDFFIFNGYGNVESIEWLHRWIEVDELADWYEDKEHVLTSVESDAWELYEEEEEEVA